MPNFFHNQKKPDPKKNCFQNYSDHLYFLQIKYQERWNKFIKNKTLDEKLDFLGKEALDHLNMFERLRDGHDYMDEFVGATAIPALGLVVSLVELGVAAWQSIKGLAIHAGLAKNDYEDHKENAGLALLVAGAAFVTAIASFIKSVVALVARPFITAARGWANQDEERFYVEETVGDKFSKAFDF
jgi:hypothetical protein